MTEEVITENREPQKANPYNAKKDWHNVKDKPFVSSDNLFFDKPVSTEHDESDEIEAIKSEEMTEFEKAEYNKKLRKGKRSVWGEWNEAAEKQFFKGEKWEYKNGD